MSGDPVAGPAAQERLIERVTDALGTLESSGDSVSLGAETAALLRALREALAGLRATRSDENAVADAHAFRALIHRILEGAVRRPVRLAFDRSPFAGEWTDLLLEAVVESDFTVGRLFFARARMMGDRTLFLLPSTRREGRLSWAETEARVLEIGRALMGFREQHPEGTVALVGPNSPEIALLDLACLVAGIPNIPIPANSTTAGIEFILRHGRATVLFAGSPEIAEIAAPAAAAAGIEELYWVGPGRATRGTVRDFREFLQFGADVDADDVREASRFVTSADIATVMYTSGTTGDPKGVPFTQANLVTKRFARAAVWPDLGDGDVFLCYLPLYHTFGRWLEMLGCVFWGSVYAFVDDASIASLLFSFQRVRPTTFISVPRKWLQIMESVASVEELAAPDAEEDARITASLREITGGRLRRGLSAAGYLPPSVFRRFHLAGIELHSGFGMTEATGGITMTPSGDYQDDSIGTALPGIELKVAEDGELLIRGPYVTPPGSEDPPREDGWFATGDIVRTDADGHLRIIDRKKEILKNVQGETISPKRIETLFAEFESVERVIVLGDRREFCTALIVPPEALRAEHADSRRGDVLDSAALREMYSGVVETVNRFLAPYERILDFAVLAEDVDPETELTAKLTPRRQVISERLADAIETLYVRDALKMTVDGVPCRLPNWFLRYTGLPTGEIRVDGKRLLAAGRPLEIERVRDAGDGDGLIVRVGGSEYHTGGAELRLGEVFSRARLWLGNDAVRRFAGSGIEHWWRRGRSGRAPRTRLVRRVPEPGAPAPPAELPPGETSIATLHDLARSLARPDAESRHATVARLREILVQEGRDTEPLVRDLLATLLDDPDVRVDVLRALVPALTPRELEDVLCPRLLRDPAFLSAAEARAAGDVPLRGDQLERLAARARAWAGRRSPVPDHAVDRLLGYLVRVAVAHPASHLTVRALLVSISATESPPRREIAERHLTALIPGFRRRLPVPVLAPGITWQDAVEFQDTAPADAARIRDALSGTTLLPEAMALCAGAPLAEGTEIAARSLRVTFLGTGTGRTVHLLEWAPEGLRPGSPRYECIIKVNRSLPWESIQEEIRLLVRARTGGSGRPVVKTQGGGYRKAGVWTEEFIPGSTLDHLLENLAREEGQSRVEELWPFLISSCTGLVVEFWRRTGRRVTLSVPAPDKLVLPGHDWQLGGRLVSVAERRACRDLTAVLESIRNGIVRPLSGGFPGARLETGWPLLFSAALEVLGEEEGCRRLEDEARVMDPDAELWGAIRRFVSGVRRRGFLPLRLRVAARRYRRWAQLNRDATLEARANTLDQIEEAYGLRDLDRERPGSRLQLFRHTVFRGSHRTLTTALDDLIARSLLEPPSRAELHRSVALLRESGKPTDHDEFFLARMLYPHVDPGARAALLREGDTPGGVESGITVEHRDSADEPFRIRRPLNPGEVAALARVFRIAGIRRMPRMGEDDLLLAVDEHERVLGGIISRRLSETYVRLDWMALGRHRRDRGIGSVMLKEFLARMRAEGVRVVSTGFFRPSFFGNFGFGVDPRYAGLVRFLEPEDTDAPGAFKGERGAAESGQ